MIRKVKFEKKKDFFYSERTLLFLRSSEFAVRKTFESDVKGDQSKAIHF